ncbi:NAD(P)-binding protein [Calocera viscosa TUFC12733]|uniref:NAD(P)-binding protein n=1 Tax=Calocera viscosa (strain TUFC12733) TaxID=1330018 RepID=A0A167FJQ8_CALVF|nr:NAD(P)-binding protein [Calocera viscosa TUFC12733]
MSLTLGDLSGVGFVSGAASGMGKAVALAGMQLILVDLDLPGLEATAKETGLPADDVYIKKVDISNDKEVDELFAEIERKFGRLDYAQRSVALPVQQGANTARSSTCPRRTLTRSWTSTCAASRAEIPLMLKNKPTESKEGLGSIVNFASWSSLHGHIETPHYTTSKFTVAGVTKCLCIGYASKGIRVNAVAPGVINTPMLAPQYRDAFNVSLIPLGRLGKADDVAFAVMFLLCPRAAFVNGTIYHAHTQFVQAQDGSASSAQRQVVQT